MRDGDYTEESGFFEARWELIEVEEDDGVAWDEIVDLRSRDPEKAEQQRVHREALTLLAGPFAGPASAGSSSRRWAPGTTR